MVLRGVDAGTGPDGFYYSGKIPTPGSIKYGPKGKARLKDIAGRSRGPGPGRGSARGPLSGAAPVRPRGSPPSPASA